MINVQEWWALLDVPMDVVEGVLERDNYQCQSCGDLRVHVHHVVERSLGGKDTEENLVTTCFRCHERIHLGRLDVEMRYVDGRWHAFFTEIR